MPETPLLVEEACEACRADSVTLDLPEIEKLCRQIPCWSVVKSDGGQQLVREFRFKDFSQALMFTNLIGEMAEKQNHHPDILTRWGAVELIWYTHRISGLHRNDFRCAARCDQLYSSIPNTS